MLSTRYRPSDKMARASCRMGTRSSGRFSFWRSRPRFFIAAAHPLLLFPSQPCWRCNREPKTFSTGVAMTPWNLHLTSKSPSEPRTFFPCGVLFPEELAFLRLASKWARVTRIAEYELCMNCIYSLNHICRTECCGYQNARNMNYSRKHRNAALKLLNLFTGQAIPLSEICHDARSSFVI